MNNNYYLRNSVITYTVQKGDNLYSISKKFNTTPTTLMMLNNLSNTLLNIGQVLIIKKEEEEIPEHIGIDLCGVYQGETEVSDPIYDIYTVKKGDSLYSIAKNYQTTIANLMYMNNLNNNLLSLGQQLKVPHHASTIDYYVKPKDTLYSIASNYNVTPKKIMTTNQLDTTSLVVGQLLKIPTASSTIPTTSNTIIYTVKKGDSLYKIANNYHVSIDDIITLNNLKSNVLFIGQNLKIPASEQKKSISYIVQKGDNLYSIAKKFNTTIDKIKQENHLTSNILSINQTLIIPQ